MEREGERKGEKHQCAVASRAPPTGGRAHRPGWDSNQRPVGPQVSAQSTEPPQPGLPHTFKKLFALCVI